MVLTLVLLFDSPVEYPGYFPPLLPQDLFPLLRLESFLHY